MAINVRFQNLPNANNEILKSFNSDTAAKALEAYQPLDAKNRKREKLKALQILKQNSNSITLADINLSADSLTASLSQANGATLQAMLNLLSAKMIEQNKYTIFEKAKENKDHKEELIKKVQEKEGNKQDNKEDEDAKDSEDEDLDNDESFEEKRQQANKELIQALLKSISLYLQQIKDDILEAYQKVLDAFSLKRIRNALEEGIASIKKYLYDQPIEYIDQNVIAPIFEIPVKVRNYIDDAIMNAGTQKEDLANSFSANEIRDLLKQAANETLNNSLANSVKSLDGNVEKKIIKNKSKKEKPVQEKIEKITPSAEAKSKSIKVSSADLKLVMHQS